MLMVDINRLGMRLYIVESEKKPSLQTRFFFVRPSLSLGGDSAIGQACAAVHSN